MQLYRFLSCLVALSSSLVLGTDVSQDVKNGPNVLFIMSDDQDLHMNSMDYMPNVQRLLAQEGTTYQKHFCTTALCCPSRVSVLTGKLVHNTNVTSVSAPYGGYEKFVNQSLNDDYLPLWLQEGNVNTYYVGKLSNGLSTSNYRSPAPKGWTKSNFLLDPGMYDYLNTTWAVNQEDPQVFAGKNTIDVTTNHSLSMLEDAVAAGRQFFMTVAPAVPHLGLDAVGKGTHAPIPQDKWKGAFANATIPRVGNFNPQETSGASWLRKLDRLNDTSINAMDEYYRARLRVVAGLDDMVHELVQSLDRRGILNSTYVIYTTDNGYHIGQYRLGPGKKCGFDTDINIPLVVRGPGIPKNRNTDVVTTHTDLAPTFLRMLGLPERSSFDGATMPITQDALDRTENTTAYEHVNIEFWGSGSVSEFIKVNESAAHHISEDPSTNGGNGDDDEPDSHKPSPWKNNTYKSVRLLAPGFDLYYAVWCTNEYELYDLKTDPWQVNNLLAGNHSDAATRINGFPLSRVADRLDALLLVLKSCKGDTCRNPWWQLHPQGNVKSLADAMKACFDQFYKEQVKVSFSACKPGYLIEFEGPQRPKPYQG